MDEKKLRLLIAEDETRIGQLIRKLIHWEELHLECAGVVENGKDAYQAIERDHPDVVITDIRMPKINGLDLIEMVRKQYPDIRFIVLSGYREFEYAHRALQYEVDGYLLKPINEAELNEALAKTVAALDDKRREAIEKQQMQREVDESRQIIRRDFLRTIIEQEESGAFTDMEAEGRIPVELTGDIFRAIDIKLDAADPDVVTRKEEKMIADRVTAIVEQNFSGFTDEVLCCEKDSMHIYCLFNYRSGKSKEIRNCISLILSEIKNYLIRFEQFEVTIGIGSERAAFPETRISIREANRAVNNRIHLGCGRLIYSENVEDLRLYVSPVKGAAEELTGLMEAHKSAEASALVRKIFEDYTSEENADYSGCYEIAEELTDLLFERMEGEEGELSKNRKRMQSRCQNINSLPALSGYVADEYARTIDLMREAAESESAKPVRIAKAYIDEHYGDKIVLEDLAELVSLNPVYFSVLFKKETEMNFSSYLTHVRMEKAKELLRTTNETIAAVGAKVGYKDSRHFSQTFTKTVGVKPVLYRRLHA